MGLLGVARRGAPDRYCLPLTSQKRMLLLDVVDNIYAAAPPTPNLGAILAGSWGEGRPKGGG